MQVQRGTVCFNQGHNTNKILNLQGDVIQLRDSNSAVVANYTYDAWGKLLSVTNASGAAITSSTNIANINPIRYRGYFYDTETKLYYCNSRYYDPQIKRFINADEYISTGTGFLAYNMFAYCENNPVMYSDPSGYDSVSIRYFVENRGGEVIWSEESRTATFHLNGKTLIASADGSNSNGIGISNENWRLMANDYDIAYYFRVENWAIYLIGFQWIGGHPRYGFVVYSINYFERKSFCLDFAASVMEAANVGADNEYLGYTMEEIAYECYSHAVLYGLSPVSLFFFDRGYQINAQSFEIGFVANDSNAYKYKLIWNLGTLINGNANSDIFD